MTKTPSNNFPLDKNYWETRYQESDTGWDLGKVSPPIKQYIDTLQNKDSRILIPGCGNTYEAEYLLMNGFTNVTVIDIAPTLVAHLQNKFKDNPSISVLLGDFLNLRENTILLLNKLFLCFRSNIEKKLCYKNAPTPVS